MLFVFLFALMTVPAASVAPEEAEAADKPNILFILTDDLDTRADNHMPQLRQRVMARGVSFDRAFVTNPICCPSRASFLTGKYVHNHTVYSNHLEIRGGLKGGAPQFRRSGEDQSTMATMLKEQGYRTIFMGKYMSYYNTPAYVPPGWDFWIGQMGVNNNHRYSVNGKRVVRFNPRKYYETNIFGRRATSQIRASARGGEPFFMQLSLNSPHAPERGLPRHRQLYRGAKLPTPPNYNEADVSDKPPWIRAQRRIGASDRRAMTSLHRNRLRSMKAVDEMLARLIGELHRSGELENTYIFFTSDNGFHLGQHRMLRGKGTTYEGDIRVPLYIRGPGVPAGVRLDHMALNTDLAPTFVDLAGGQAPDTVDGRSLAPLIGQSKPPAGDAWRESFLVEIYGTRHPAFALRTGRYSYVEYESGHKELYDMRSDPHQLESLHGSPALQPLMDEFHDRLQRLKICSGQASCEAAEKPPASS